MVTVTKVRNLEDILTEEQIKHIIDQTSTSVANIVECDIRPASEGLTGFLGDHLKVTLQVKDGDIIKNVHLFIKTVPNKNAEKAKYIDEFKFFLRESLTFKIFEELPDEECPNPWAVRSLASSDKFLVLPDISVEGYRTYGTIDYLDMNHLIVCLNSIARFHAAVANYQTKNITSENQSYKLPEDYQCFLTDPQFFDCPWFHATITTTASFLKKFSKEIDKYPEDLHTSLREWCIEVATEIREYDNTLNVLIHKDLWSNNILFKYENELPTNAILVDFQCVRNAPPALDVLMFLYFNTSRDFQKRHEMELLELYYSAFIEHVNDQTRARLNKLKYDLKGFLDWCEKIRLAALLVPLAIHPFILMSPFAAQKAFDDPKTFEQHILTDRSDPVIGYAEENAHYRKRLLETSEEFVDRYLQRKN